MVSMAEKAGRTGTPVAIHAAANGTNLYWVEVSGTSSYSIQKMPLAGATTSTLVVDGITWGGNVNANPPQLAVDATSVYWLGPPNLYKAPK
jgi:hypothetical protein